MSFEFFDVPREVEVKVQSVLDTLRPGSKIAVVDDSLDDMRRTSILLEDAEFVPVAIDPTFPTLQELLDNVAARADGLVCDHRLSHSATAPFTGAQVVAASNRRRVPAVLITGYADLDEQTSIRRYRSSIPCMLRKRFEPAEIESALARAHREQLIGPAPERVGYRTVVRVLRVDRIGAEPIVEVIVVAWDPVDAVILPADMITSCVGMTVDELPGKRFMARVNIHARSSEELFFENFEMAPDIPRSWLPTL
ncbi:hypothetical protein [Streptomyces xanthochromogenes]|uniref:hypothetical protein n=1 Tax=Streptomyces xanthochromogenes TaxID=67384 RepID=UPI001E4B17B3|nr:hypothetical protein [Streptomyces xanthochromogenes]